MVHANAPSTERIAHWYSGANRVLLPDLRLLRPRAPKRRSRHNITLFARVRAPASRAQEPERSDTRQGPDGMPPIHATVLAAHIRMHELSRVARPFFGWSSWPYGSGAVATG